MYNVLCIVYGVYSVYSVCMFCLDIGLYDVNKILWTVTMVGIKKLEKVME